MLLRRPHRRLIVPDADAVDVFQLAQHPAQVRPEHYVAHVIVDPVEVEALQEDPGVVLLRLLCPLKWVEEGEVATEVFHRNHGVAAQAGTDFAFLVDEFNKCGSSAESVGERARER